MEEHIGPYQSQLRAYSVLEHIYEFALTPLVYEGPVPCLGQALGYSAWHTVGQGYLQTSGLFGVLYSVTRSSRQFP
jgi:hypothetical protein